MKHTAALVAVGDELLAGAHADLDSPWLAAALLEVGIATDGVYVVGDDEDALAELLADLAAKHVLVVTSGGLGPTLDDVTRHAAARADGRELVFDEVAWRNVRALWDRRGEPTPEVNRRQALVPAGADVFENSCGTAPGFALETHRRGLLACLPGPPIEFQTMARALLLPLVAARYVVEAERPVRACVSLFGLPESRFAELAGDWMVRSARPQLGVCARAGILAVDLRWRGPDAPALVAARLAELRERFARYWVSDDHEPIEATLVRELTARGLVVTFAESCTGGLAAGALTDVPGASAVLEESFVTYGDAKKTQRLGVPAELIQRFGAVSPEVAAALASGARAASGADLAVAISGIAGPDGGNATKPVGRVEFAIAGPTGVHTLGRTFPGGSRERVRRFAVQQALALLLWATRGRLAELGLAPAPPH